MVREIKLKFWLPKRNVITRAYHWYETGAVSDLTEDVIPLEYTGLKDINGIEIYEGDILFIHNEDGSSCTSKVIWGGYYPAFDLSPSLDAEYNQLQHATLVLTCKVIGNIYNTPELLKS